MTSPALICVIKILSFSEILTKYFLLYSLAGLLY